MIYIFKCNKCYSVLEIESQPFCPPKEKEVICPDCNVDTIRIFTKPMVQYTGSGWMSQEAGVN